MLEKIDRELKAANAGVSVYQKRNRLYLQATLPPKPWLNTPKARAGKPYQQKISLGVYANPAGFRRAKAEASRLSAELAIGRFDWYEWQDDPTRRDERTTGDWVAALEKHYKQHEIEHESREPQIVNETWRTGYWAIYKKLPLDEPLSAEAMEAVVLSIEPHRRSRQRAVIAMRRLAEFAGIEIDLKGKSGHYSIYHAKPRELPDDETIEQIYHSIDHEGWKWFFGMLAAYGLRPGEAWRCDLDRFSEESPVLWVCSEKQLNGRRNYRTVLPFPARWWQDWRLWEGEPPQVEDTSNEAAKFFRRHDFGFNPYALRHRWAVRTFEMGLDPMLASKQMGHSARIHEQTYLYWMQEKTHLAAWEEVNREK
ncbi:MAG: hypothetical protein J7641_19375 [Cyanobacteria bacterium SID2]|nr:hypothetical protein [Cyanobacteria bacterium SID2]MBP0004062.1 hypothetical protein [Cyanobacteria bacterium SBC]